MASLFIFAWFFCFIFLLHFFCFIFLLHFLVGNLWESFVASLGSWWEMDGNYRDSRHWSSKPTQSVTFSKLIFSSPFFAHFFIWQELWEIVGNYHVTRSLGALRAPTSTGSFRKNVKSKMFVKISIFTKDQFSQLF